MTAPRDDDDSVGVRMCKVMHAAVDGRLDRMESMVERHGALFQDYLKEQRARSYQTAAQTIGIIVTLAVVLFNLFTK